MHVDSFTLCRKRARTRQDPVTNVATGPMLSGKCSCDWIESSSAEPWNRWTSRNSELQSRRRLYQPRRLQWRDDPWQRFPRLRERSLVRSRLESELRSILCVSSLLLVYPVYALKTSSAMMVTWRPGISTIGKVLQSFSPETPQRTETIGGIEL